MSGGWLIAPYALWMLLMTALPSTTAMYAVRTAAVAALLLAMSLWVWRRQETGQETRDERQGSASCLASQVSFSSLVSRLLSSLPLSLFVGLAVFAIWILPEQFDFPFYRRFCILGEGGTVAVDQSPAWLLAVRLIGSAFVISAAEELFFRKWLIKFAGFWWMVALFAIEHDRWLVGAIAGVAYGFLYLRKGLLGAIIAHAVTNLVLGLWVLGRAQWQFW